MKPYLITLVDNAGLTKIANKSFWNRSVLRSDLTIVTSLLSPLIYLHPNNKGAEHYLCLKGGVILASASFVREDGIDKADNAKILKMYGLCVRPFHRNRGMAGDLMREVFRTVAEGGYTLTTTPFSTKGRKCLAPTIAKLHCSEFPHVAVLYPGSKDPVKGNPSYTFPPLPTFSHLFTGRYRNLKESLNKLLTLSP